MARTHSVADAGVGAGAGAATGAEAVHLIRLEAVHVAGVRDGVRVHPVHVVRPEQLPLAVELLRSGQAASEQGARGLGRNGPARAAGLGHLGARRLPLLGGFERTSGMRSRWDAVFPADREGKDAAPSTLSLVPRSLGSVICSARFSSAPRTQPPIKTNQLSADLLYSSPRYLFLSVSSSNPTHRIARPYFPGSQKREAKPCTVHSPSIHLHGHRQTPCRVQVVCTDPAMPCFVGPTKFRHTDAALTGLSFSAALTGLSFSLLD